MAANWSCATNFSLLNKDRYVFEHLELRNRIAKKLKVSGTQKPYLALMYHLTKYSIEKLREIEKQPNIYFSPTTLNRLIQDFQLPSQQ